MTTTEERLLRDGGPLEQIQALLSVAYGPIPFMSPYPLQRIMAFLCNIGIATRSRDGIYWVLRDIPQKGSLEEDETACTTCPHHKIETVASVEAGMVWGCKYTPETLCSLNCPGNLIFPRNCPVFCKGIVE